MLVLILSNEKGKMGRPGKGAVRAPPVWKLPETDPRHEARRRDAVVRTLARELSLAGKPVIYQDGSDPPVMGFANPDLNEALTAAAKEGCQMYDVNTPYREELKSAISDFEKKYRNIDCPPENILITPGVAGGWQSLQSAVIHPADEIVTFEPGHYYSGPSIYLALFFNVKTVGVRSFEEEDWEPDLDELRKKITDKTRLIAFTYPVNPTGAIYKEKTLKEICNIAGEYGLPVATDEIYGMITYDGIKAKSLLNVAGDTPAIMLNGMSKFFMRTGWRVGYMCLHDPEGKMKDMMNTIKARARMYGHAESCIPTPIIYAAREAYRGSIDASMEMVKETERRRDYQMKRIRETPGIDCVKSKATLMAFPRILGIGTTWKTDEEFLVDLLKEENIGYYIGSKFGMRSGQGHVRALLQTDIDILEEFYNRLERFMSKHA